MQQVLGASVFAFQRVNLLIEGPTLRGLCPAGQGPA